MYLAIAILLDDHTTEWATAHRHGIARHFPVHITLMAKLSVADSADLTAVAGDLDQLLRIPMFAIRLDAPFCFRLNAGGCGVARAMAG